MERIAPGCHALSPQAGGEPSRFRGEKVPEETIWPDRDGFVKAPSAALRITNIIKAHCLRCRSVAVRRASLLRLTKSDGAPKGSCLGTGVARFCWSLQKGVGQARPNVVHVSKPASGLPAGRRETLAQVYVWHPYTNRQSTTKRNLAKDSHRRSPPSGLRRWILPDPIARAGHRATASSLRHVWRWRWTPRRAGSRH
jgi:hypothetical protein